ncbi:GNAT family N-acetyltransferase [Leucobacter massiliensis]|uniref:GNAT family N-acetyltransferase n=1 Tax=Leucobacter massiliensis TaxID=1686285 RepID=A0A2S9QLD8_9MICO|nr:GNAT family N-acetyltransferase [Leucobacter massiliensis]PRI10399.1 GNAT family N-acetyltransferase [Leucobacter massiliensis]
MSHSTDVTVRPITAADEARWRELYRGYREFYKLAADEAVVSTVWGWLMDPAHVCEALVAEHAGRVVGLANHRWMPRPSTGDEGLWLDDLFTDPEVRGRGVGRALIAGLVEIAAARPGASVSWITAADNHQAQALYNKVAYRTHWVTYDTDPADAA